jgi:hypothetical protein
MKQTLLFTVIVLLSFLFSCKNQKNEIIQSGVIDVESSLDNLSRLKVSDFGKTVRYISLETTDEGLVGGNPLIKVLKNHIVVEAQQKCLVFDKKDGHFIAKIGHFGQDPEAYTDYFSWTDEKEEFLYFSRRPNQLMKYNMQGKFCGKIEFASPPGMASYYLWTDSEIFGCFGESLSNAMPFILGVFDRDGNLKDTIPSLFSRTQVVIDEIVNINVVRSYLYGNWSGSGVIIINYKNDTRQYTVPNARTLWKYNENIRFKEAFVDTVYMVSGNNLIPSIIFHTGKYHWPFEERTNKRYTNDRIFIADVSENKKFVFFQCIKGMNSDEPVLYNGLYHKQTGETKLSKNSDGIEDDLTRFMPFTPFGISTSGEFVSLVEAYKVMEWLEKHPEAKNNEKLSFLKELNDEMNPVVILVE